MSGGIAESFDLKKLSSTERANFWKILYQSYQKNSIIGCNIAVSLITRKDCIFKSQYK
jgi:hypothetical protein